MTSLARPHSPSYHSTSHLTSLSRLALLSWFDTTRDARAMPWRRRFDPTLTREELGQRAYEIMISEVMLQQTQIATVIPFWERWMEKYPTIKDLSDSTDDDVTASWTGLGYYSRAKRLLAAAKKTVAEYDGILPSSPKVLEKEVPGIGPYTAGAIASIAYNVQTPLIDGNVHRVLARLLGLYSNPTGKVLLSTLWSAAGELVPEDRPGDWNESLMELGATICKPTDAKCGECPLSSVCRANAEFNNSVPLSAPPDIEDLCELCVPIPSPASVTSFPMKAVKKAAREEETATVIVEWRVEGRESKYLVIKRPEKGLLAGLYEFPSFTLPTSTTPTGPLPLPKLLTHLRTLLPKRLLKDPTHKPLDSTFHQYSHISMTYHVSHLILSPPPPSTEEEDANGGKEQDPPEVERGMWMEGKQGVEGVSMSTGGKKCWQLLVGNGKGKAAPKRRVNKAAATEVGDAEEAEGGKGKGKAKGSAKKKAKKEETEDRSQTTLSKFFAKPSPSTSSSTAQPIPSKDTDSPIVPPTPFVSASTSSSESKSSTSHPPPLNSQKQKRKPPKRKYAVISESESSEGEIEIVETPSVAADGDRTEG